MKHHLGTLVAALVLSGCSGEYTDAQLVGTYIAEFRGDTATLTLNADRSYAHVVRRRSGETIEANVHNAQWTQSPEGEGFWKSSRVEFSGFKLLPAYIDANPSADPATRRRWMTGTGWSTPVERTWLGMAQLCFDDDVGYCYVKQAP
jgi:hypothetical protein